MNKTLLVITMLTLYRAYTDTTIIFYVNEWPLREDMGENQSCTYETKKNGILDVEELKEEVKDVTNKKINSIIKENIRKDDLIFVNATVKRTWKDINIGEDKKIILNNYNNETICLYYITKQIVDTIKKIEINQITLNGEKINIDKNKFQFFRDINENIVKNDSYIRTYIKNKALGLDEVKNALKNVGEKIDTTLWTRNYGPGDLIKYADYIIADKSTITIKITAQHKDTYNVQYIPPKGTTLRAHIEESGCYHFNANDKFGDDIAVPKTISVNYIDKKDKKDKDGKTIKEQIMDKFGNKIYNEFEFHMFNILDEEILKKEIDYTNKINNGGNIKLPEGKDWNKLEPNDIIKVELSEKSELVKSLIVPIEINPPEGHQLTGLLEKRNKTYITISGISDINDKDAIKNALKEKLSAMQINVNNKRLKIPQETIETITSNISITNEGLTKTIKTQIPITAKDFIATEQEIEQRKQEKQKESEEQGKDKKHQQFGMPEVAGKCCACCGGCCKGECCKGGCCKENNSGG